MPKDYGIKGPRSGSGLLSWARVSRQIAAARNYWIVTARPDGRPHAMPVWGIWMRERLVFSTSRASRKARNLAFQPDTVFHLESGDEAVIVEGRAEEVLEPGLLLQYVDLYEVKYNFRPDPDNKKEITFAVQPAVAFAWLEKDFPGGATRWKFESPTIRRKSKKK